MISLLQMKNPEAKKYKAHISIKQQNLCSSWDQPNPGHTLWNTQVIYLNDAPAKWPFIVSGRNSLPFFPCQIWPCSESPARVLGKTEIGPLTTSTQPFPYEFPPVWANTPLQRDSLFRN